MVAKLMPKSELAELKGVIAEAEDLISSPRSPDEDSDGLGI